MSCVCVRTHSEENSHHCTSLETALEITGSIPTDHSILPLIGTTLHGYFQETS